MKQEYYADYDEDTAFYCVFGTEDGKAYASYAAECQARSKAEEMNAVIDSEYFEQ